MKKQISYTVAAILAVTLMAAGCGGNSASKTGQPENGQQSEAPQPGTSQPGASQAGTDRNDVIVVMGPTSEPEAGFDPAYGWGAGEHVHEPLIQSTLTVTTTDLKIGYDLATGMEASDDGLTWTVTIRDDVSLSLIHI